MRRWRRPETKPYTLGPVVRLGPNKLVFNSVTALRGISCNQQQASMELATKLAPRHLQQRPNHQVEGLFGHVTVPSNA